MPHCWPAVAWKDRISTMSKLSNDDIGALGQEVLRGWCTQLAATATQPQRDKHGWDFYVQLAAPHGPDDVRERNCKVQVKTTTTGQPSAEISMTNLELMALERVPWFILYVMVEGVIAKAAYLLHIDEGQVGRILKRRQEIEPGSSTNNVAMTISARAEDALAEPFHASLGQRLLKDMGESEKAYYDAKSKWIETAGFDEAPIRLAVTFPPMEDSEHWEQVANWAIGLVEKMPFASVKAEKIRFGEVAELLTEGGAGTMSAPDIPPSGSRVVTFSNTDRSEMVSIKCEMFVASRVIPFLPPEYNRVRFHARGIDITLRQEDGRPVVTIKFPLPGTDGCEEHPPLAELARACRIVRLVSQARDKGAWIDVAGVATSRAQLAPLQLDPELRRLALIVESAAAIISDFGVEPDTQVDIEELRANAFDVVLLHAGLRRDVGAFDTSVNFARFEGAIQIAKPAISIVHRQILRRSDWDEESCNANLLSIMRKAANDLRADGFDIIVAPPGVAEDENEPDNPAESLDAARAAILKPAEVVVGSYVVSALFAITGTSRWLPGGTTAKSAVLDANPPVQEGGGHTVEEPSEDSALAGERRRWQLRAKTATRAS
jgi:hypothetical protein